MIRDREEPGNWTLVQLKFAEQDATLLVSQVVVHIQSAGSVAGPQGQRLIRR
jgi:hypothetical protein